MSKIINGVASEYDMPMIYENKSTTNRIKNEEIFTRWQDPAIKKLQRENEKLQNNWNELKEYCKNNYYGTTTVGVLEKMQELEIGDDNNE